MVVMFPKFLFLIKNAFAPASKVFAAAADILNSTGRFGFANAHNGFSEPRIERISCEH